MNEPTPIDELDLRTRLAGHAAAVRPVADPVRLRESLARADRLRTVRATATAGVMALAVAFGVWNLQGVQERSLVDTVDQPELEMPDPSVPAIADAETEDEPATPGVETVTITSTPRTPGTDPDHLRAPTTTATPIVAVVSPSTTTTPPPPPTAAPATTHAPPPTTTAAVVATGPFTAHARYGSCDLDPPYDEYHGTAAPGASVTITSPYSTPTTAVAGADGSWAVTVYFPSAPANEAFTVTLTDGATTLTHGFVRVV